MVLEKLGKFDEMEKLLCCVMQLVLGNQYVYNVLGYLLVDCNICLLEVLELIQKVVDLVLEDFFIVDSLGWVLFCMGCMEQVEIQMCCVYGLCFDVEIGVYLGEVLWINGKQDEVCKVWCEVSFKEFDNEVLKSMLLCFNVKL